MKYEIIDFHTHPFTCAGTNIASHKAHCDMSLENIPRDMKAVGISKICGSAIARKKDMAEKYGVAPEELSWWDTVRESNEEMLRVRAVLGDFYVPGFHVHPDYIAESVQTIEEMDARGIKLVGEIVPYCHGWEDYSCKGFSELIDCASAHGMIISLHSMGEDEMDRMVAAHPEATFVFAHPGEYGALMRHFGRMKNRPNCYMDISGYGPFRYGMIRAAIDELGAEHILYGSDYPTCSPAMYVGSVVLEPLLTEREKQMILAENTRNLFAKAGVKI